MRRHGSGSGTSPQDRGSDQQAFVEFSCSTRPEIQRVIAHIRLPDQGGLIRGLKSIHGGSDIPDILELSWKGHEFLNDVRGPVVWGKTKGRQCRPECPREIARAEIKTKLGLP
jgi:hypothetical protein